MITPQINRIILIPFSQRNFFILLIISIAFLYKVLSVHYILLIICQYKRKERGRKRILTRLGVKLFEVVSNLEDCFLNLSLIVIELISVTENRLQYRMNYWGKEMRWRRAGRFLFCIFQRDTITLLRERDSNLTSPFSISSKIF